MCDCRDLKNVHAMCMHGMSRTDNKFHLVELDDYHFSCDQAKEFKDSPHTQSDKFSGIPSKSH